MDDKKYSISTQQILFSHKKYEIHDTYYNKDEPWKYYAKWKKPITQDLILHDSILIRCPE